MPITLNCGCGKVLRIADEHAGKRVKCPACSTVLSSAPPPPAFEVVEDELKQLARPVAKARVDDDDDDGGSYDMKKVEKVPDPPAMKPSFRKRADDDDEDTRPRRRRGRSARQAGAMAGSDAGKRLGYMVGGTALALIGIVLAYFAWANEWRTRSLILGIALIIG